ncbi:DUF2285 domain-containing protein, partial [Aliidongia dinghuensis]|uniref:DUF2285 domain-containing protein n=1 Tax=Aliidongia dinghuensis TaxID=1867774 RepID=UPI00166EAFFB
NQHPPTTRSHPGAGSLPTAASRGSILDTDHPSAGVNFPRRITPNPSALTAQATDRLILALRALDGKLDGATQFEIATALFRPRNLSKRDWIDHDLRDRTGRLVRLGLRLMNGGYRRLLLHPFRRKI